MKNGLLMDGIAGEPAMLWGEDMELHIFGLCESCGVPEGEFFYDSCMWSGERWAWCSAGPG